MEINVQSIHFDADAKLTEFIEKTDGVKFMEAPRRFAINQRALGVGVLVFVGVTVGVLVKDGVKVIVGVIVGVGVGVGVGLAARHVGQSV
jgi:hypothetical protein